MFSLNLARREIAGILAIFLLVLVPVRFAAAQSNSTRKIRIRPSEVASKIGSAVKWRVSYQEALKESKASGKPIFWYVPTLRGSFMDRKNEINWYMLGGPFSWPKIVKTLNSDYIPVKAKPNPSEQKQFGLLRLKFVEPGFLVVDSEEKMLKRIDRLSTLHPQWLYQLVQPAGKTATAGTFWEAPADSDLGIAWSKFVNGDRKTMLAKPAAGSVHAVEQYLLRGILAQVNGNNTQAKKEWAEAVKADPNHPLAFKAAAEMEGIGPMVRGFEVFSKLPSKALKAGIDSVGSAAPAGVYSSQQIWERSVDYLLSMQQSDGGFVDSYYDFGGTDSLPNVYVAVTSLVGMALVDAKDRLPARADEIQTAIDKAVAYAMNPKNINRVDRDEILWAYAYRLRFLTRLAATGKDVKDELQKATTSLEGVQSKRGNWYHEYNNSFVTATALIALHDAKNAGATVDQKKIEAGLKSLSFDRFESGAFPYASRRPGQTRRREEPIGAAAGRMPLCELGLYYWGKSDQKSLKYAVDMSFKFHKNLEAARKYDDHTNIHAYGGFFYFYDMRSRAEAINQLEDLKVRTAYEKKHREILSDSLELDGCFIDSHELGRCYGTAMGLLCLERTRERK